jgi:hypothetical protein
MKCVPPTLSPLGAWHRGRTASTAPLYAATGRYVPGQFFLNESFIFLCTYSHVFDKNFFTFMCILCFSPPSSRRLYPSSFSIMSIYFPPVELLYFHTSFHFPNRRYLFIYTSFAPIWLHYCC